MSTGGVQARGVAKRAAILAAGVELLTRAGTAAVTHRQVAERAGVSHGAIRYYFASREALLLACLQDIEEQRATEAGLAVAEAERDGGRATAEATARRIVRCFAGPDLSDDALRGAMGWLIDTTRESSDLSAELSRERRAIEDQTQRLLRASGFDDVAAGLVVALTEGAILNLVVQHRPAVADGAVAALVQLVLHPRHRETAKSLPDRARSGDA